MLYASTRRVAIQLGEAEGIQVEKKVNNQSALDDRIPCLTVLYRLKDRRRMKSLAHDCKKRSLHDRTKDQNGDSPDPSVLAGRCSIMQVGRRRCVQIVFSYPFRMPETLHDVIGRMHICRQ